MDCLVQPKLGGRPANPLEGIVFIEQSILPTLELCKKLEAEKQMVAGGRSSGSIALSLIVGAESVQEPDALIASLPVWPLMETTVTPLTTFNGRARAVRARLEQLKTRGGDR
jgi:muconolactone delta-isomerase